MPIGSQKILPIFSSSGKVTIDQNINAFFMESGVLSIQHEDFYVHLFIETLIEVIAEWFAQLPVGSVTSWETLIQAFKRRFKTIEDEHFLLSQLN